MRLLVIDAVGLRLGDLSEAPNIRGLAERGFAAPLDPVLPALTCSVQATWLTGALPREHGVVGNGWYFRDLAQVWFWRQSNALVQGEKIYQTARRRWPAFTCAKLFWWWNMYADVEYSLTPRPEYHADGLKKPGLYGAPADLPERVQERLGPFPLFQFWGPGAGIASTRWIADAALAVLEEHDPTLQLVYLPHLDYDHQRFGPDAPASRRAVADLDREAGRLIEAASARGADVVVLSEYGIEPVERPVFLNRLLHEWGELRVQETSHGQLLDCGACAAFAVCDHQIAHVYVADGDRVALLAARLRGVEGVAEVLDRSGQARHGLDHPRSGELVLVAEAGCWFAYPYWLDESRRPDFATTVDIHRKPGYDPAELFIDPRIRFPRLRIARRLLRKKLGFRTLLDVIPTDPSIVRGSHGRLPACDESGPLFVSSGKRGASARVGAVSVRDRLLDLL